MKKMLYRPILSLLVSALVCTNCETKPQTTEPSTPKTTSAAQMKAAREKWEASPDGISYKKWQSSAAGKKVSASTARISKSVRDYNYMQAVVSSLTLPPDTKLGFAVMVRIDQDDYILMLGSSKSGTKEWKQIKVKDTLLVKSHHVLQAPKYAYPILQADYVEKEGKTIYKRLPGKDGC